MKFIASVIFSEEQNQGFRQYNYLSTTKYNDGDVVLVPVGRYKKDEIKIDNITVAKVVDCFEYSEKIINEKGLSHIKLKTIFGKINTDKLYDT